MSGTTSPTFRDFFCPGNDHDTRVILSDVIEGPIATSAATTSSFALGKSRWDPKRLPALAHLFEDLPSKMLQNLRAIIDQHYPDQSASPNFTDHRGRIFTPDGIKLDIEARLAPLTLNLSYEPGVSMITEVLRYSVQVLYAVLTGDSLEVNGQSRTRNNAVRTDHLFSLGDRSGILWEDKSPKAFDKFIGELMEKMRDGSTVLCRETKPTVYKGYKAICGKVRVCPCQTSHIQLMFMSSLRTTRATVFPGSVGQSYSADSDILLSTSHAHLENLRCTVPRSCGFVFGPTMSRTLPFIHQFGVS
jgi:hypothetical protein